MPFLLQKGHITPACQTEARQNGKKTHWRPDHRAYHMEENPKAQDTQHTSCGNSSVYSMYPLKPSTTCVPPIMANLNVNGENLSFDIDTRAAISVISETTYVAHTSKTEIIQLERYSYHIYRKNYPSEGENRNKCQVWKPGDYTSTHDSARSCPQSDGRDWLESLRLDWPNMIHSMPVSSAENILINVADLFNDELGTIRDVKAHLYVRDDAIPRFLRPCPVPYALRDKVNMELQRLETL